MRITHLPFVAQVTMVVSGGATLLALAGVLMAALLIFTTSLAVLWPAPIGCACAAAVGAIIFMVVRCASLKNGGKNTEKNDKSSAVSQFLNAETENFDSISSKELNSQKNHPDKDAISIQEDTSAEKEEEKGEEMEEELIRPILDPKHGSLSTELQSPQYPNSYDNAQLIDMSQSQEIDASLPENKHDQRRPHLQNS